MNDEVKPYEDGCPQMDFIIYIYLLTQMHENNNTSSSSDTGGCISQVSVYVLTSLQSSGIARSKSMSSTTFHFIL